MTAKSANPPPEAGKSSQRQRPPKRHAAGVDHEPTHHRGRGAVITGGFAAVLVAGFVAAPREHAALPYVAQYAMTTALSDWKLLEPVNEVVYGSRGFDTFGETFLLLAAVVSVVMLTRPREARRGYFGEHVAGQREQALIDPNPPADSEERRSREAELREQAEGGADLPPRTPDDEPLGTPGPERAEAMTVIVRTAIRVAAPVLAVTGLYLVAWGYSPGGGFPGGAVVLGVVLLAYAAFGRRRIARIARPALLEGAEMAGAALIVGTELLGLLLRGSFSANWLPLTAPGTIRSGGVVQLFSAGELIEVATGLMIAVFAMLGMRHDWASHENGENDEDETGASEPAHQEANP